MLSDEMTVGRHLKKVRVQPLGYKRISGRETTSAKGLRQECMGINNASWCMDHLHILSFISSSSDPWKIEKTSYYFFPFTNE